MILSIDLGTTNLKTVLVTDSLEVVDSEKQPVSPDNAKRQDTEKWISALDRCLTDLLSGHATEIIEYISASSTSGTVIPINNDGVALSSAIMYNVTYDTYSEFESQDKDDYFKPTFTLPKVYWFKQKRPDIYKSATKFLNPTDFVIQLLTNVTNRTDPTNAYKLGYHPEEGWKTDFLDRIGIELKKLPSRVVEDNYIGDVETDIGHRHGLEGTPVYNGTVDSVANFIATNIGNQGSWSTSLGSSLSIKGLVKSNPNSDRFYGYPHPETGFICGGHSSVGTRWMVDDYSEGFIDKQLDELSSIETKLIAYPREGSEVLPIERDHIPNFINGCPSSKQEEFEAKLKSTLFFEKWIYDQLEEMGYPVSYISSTGYLSEFENINQLRATVLDREVRVLDGSYLSTAIGSASVVLYRNDRLSSLNEYPSAELFETYYPSNEASRYTNLFRQFKEYFEESAWS